MPSPSPPRLFTPYDADLHGLEYAADEQWYENGHALLEHLTLDAVSDEVSTPTANSVI